jgi:hypothetical protein
MAPASYRLTLKYTGKKAARLVSGIPQWQVCSIFKDDLTALGVNHPKVDQIQQGPPGSIYFIYTHNNKHNVRAYGLMMVAVAFRIAHTVIPGTAPAVSDR